VSGHIVDTALFEEFGLRILVHERNAHALHERNLKIVGLFCKRALQKRPIFSEDLRSCQSMHDQCMTTKWSPENILQRLYGGVATISRLLKMIGFFGEYRSLL